MDQRPLASKGGLCSIWFCVQPYGKAMLVSKITSLAGHISLFIGSGSAYRKLKMAAGGMAVNSGKNL